MNPIAGHNLNYCPCCGCNLMTVAAALQFAALRAQGNGGGPTKLLSPNPEGTLALTNGKRPRDNRPWTDEDFEKIRELKEQKLTLKQIAQEIGRTHASVSAHYYSPEYKKRFKRGKAATAKKSAKGAKLTPNDLKKVLHLRDEQKLKASEIAKKLNWDTVRVYGAFAKAKKMATTTGR